MGLVPLLLRRAPADVRLGALARLHGRPMTAPIKTPRARSPGGFE